MHHAPWTIDDCHSHHPHGDVMQQLLPCSLQWGLRWNALKRQRAEIDQQCVGCVGREP